MKFSAYGRMCSFCGRPGERGTPLAGGLGALMCRDCVQRYHAIFSSTRRTKAVSRPPWEDMDDADLLQMLPAIVDTSTQVQEFLTEWIDLIRGRDVTWERIGNALGISRQAAWERFAGHPHRSS